MIGAFVVVLAWTVTSCTATVDCDGNYSVSERFSPEERERIYMAGRKWNDFVGREVIRFNGSRATDGCGINRLSTQAEYEHLRDELVYREFAGVHVGDTGAIYINMSKPVTLDRMQTTTMHELGHGQGLAHVKHGIMGAPASSPDFTQDDLNECIRRGVCTPTSVVSHDAGDAP